MRAIAVTRSVCIAAAFTAAAVACGSTADDSNFDDPTVTDPTQLDEAGVDSSLPDDDDPGGNFTDDDSGTGSCKPKTCAELGANCGPIGDGCGNVIQCGDCGDGKTCGGGGVPSQCGAPACTTKTCAELDANCGAIGDGCGGLIASCGACGAGEICGGGGPSKCGPGTGDPDGGPGCTPVKTACAPGDCGFIADGCGGVIDCTPAAWQACPAGETCGGGGTPNFCGAPPCVKNTCGSKNCGYIADGCGGLLNCWPAGTTTCPPGQTCGGDGTENKCGTDPSCTGLCLQQQACPGGGTTSIEGYVTSPNGKLPVPNAVVYVPNGTVAAFQSNVQCETCATASGNPLVSTTTDANGHFFLPNVPVSTPGKTTNIPVVAQLGRWRKQFTITTTACTNNLVPKVGDAAANKTAALPADKTEGDIPLTAISTGSVDGLECVFRKMGVKDSEFTGGNGSGRIRLYRDNGAKASGSNLPTASALYSSESELAKFDAVIFGCVGSESSKDAKEVRNVVEYANKGGRVFATHYSYIWLKSASDTTPWCGWPFQPACKDFTSPWTSMVNNWGSQIAWEGKNNGGSLSAIVDTSFPKGVLFSNWLKAPVGTPPASYPPPYANVNALYGANSNPPMIALTEPRRNITPASANAATSGIVSPAQRWIYTTDDNDKTCTVNSNCKSGVCTAGKCVGTKIFNSSDPDAKDAPMHFTFNTDTTKPAVQQCGRVLYSDFHVSVGNTSGDTFPAECSSDFTSQEKVLAYMLFDLASCVSTAPPTTCKPKTCAEQGLGCGPAGDGCGGQIDCGDCPNGLTCGGGGVPSQCGAPTCTPKTCQANQCGKMGDGCGGQIDCGGCEDGKICGGGGPNLCGAGTCTPTVCPTPGPGSVCGPVANGCGNVNNCPCAAGVPCVNGTCGAPTCTPLTCAKAGANCGQIGDGCGKLLDCGTCVAPQTCGGGGSANLCGGGVN